MSLRERAQALDARPDTSAIGKLLADADEALVADVEDLLFGEPRIAHVIVAKVLSDEFGTPIGPKQVEAYRKKPRR